jgi:hypothetical protein
MAATIIPVSGTGGSYAGYDASNAIDQGPNAALTDWASNSKGTASILDIDLGGQYFLSGFSLVDRVTSGGGNGSFVGGTSDFTTSFSLTYYSDATFTTPGLSYIFSKSTPLAPTGPSDFAFSGALGGGKVQYVRYSVLGTNGVNPGLSNLSFAGSVPEASTWAMMLLGFGLMGFGLRYRRKDGDVSFA